MVEINPNRLMHHLQTLRQFGAKDAGVVRPALSTEDIRARKWLVEQLSSTGLQTDLDAVGNVFGISPHPGRALLVGSHSDTQPTGGWLDGALGVVYALECAQAFAECSQSRNLPLDVVSWQDEEGRFLGCLGSRSFVGLLDDEDLNSITSKDGVLLRHAQKEAGLQHKSRRTFKSLSRDYGGFFEAHIEQGPTLFDEGASIGVVDHIVALRSLIITFDGQQNHAGTTMMHRRRDASMGLYRFADQINRRFPEFAGERTVWTMGRALITPNAASIIPGHASLELQFRDPNEAVLETLEKEAQTIAQEINEWLPIVVNVTRARPPIAPVAMSTSMQDAVREAGEKHAPGHVKTMPSGAFHDASILAQVMPSAMMFIPSIDGISHDFAENSRDEDIILGCRVFCDAAETLLLQWNR